MPTSEEVRKAGQEISASPFLLIAEKFNAAIAQFAGWPYEVASAALIDADSNKTATFSSVIFAGNRSGKTVDELVPADSVGAVIDINKTLDLEGLRAAYRRIVAAKKLKKSPAPTVTGPCTNVTLGVIYGHAAGVPLEGLADELQKLNVDTPSDQWPDLIAVSNVGTVQYAVQFPGEELIGDFLPPAEGALKNYTPPFYVVMTLRVTGEYTFNKMLAFLVAHLAIFSPGAKLPDWSKILEAIPKTAITVTGYQYDLAGVLRPVPREFYNDRYFPPPPLRIETQKGELLSTIRFLPWQDGGVVLMQGKLPLSGIMVFFGKKGIERGGTIHRPPDLQISYVAPITVADFREAMIKLQRQSNMLVKSGEGKFVIQKFADEGASSPFMARILLGILRLRDLAYSNHASRESFDKHYEFVTSSLMNARSTAHEILKMWQEHTRRISAGEIARIDGRLIRVDENIDKELRKDVEGFLNVAVRTLKQGMQILAKELQTDIGILFKKQTTFDAGIAALKRTDPVLADYLEETRGWSEPLVHRRNEIEHIGWSLSRISYEQIGNSVRAQESLIDGTRFTEVVSFLFDRLCCFVEEVTAYCLQRQMPAEITIREIPLADRSTEMPERFQVTLTRGGYYPWTLAYHTSKFEET